MVHISLLMMLKNEHARLPVTLKSVADHIDSLIIFDTGSTDDTIDILRKFSKEQLIPLHLKEGEFVDFSTSRNVSLDFADEVAKEIESDFLLLMDCNDELRGGKQLRRFCEEQLKTKETAWLVNQEWFSGVYNKYYNLRLIKPNHTWRYCGVVHEYLQKQNQKDIYVNHKIPPPVCLFQDRTSDDDKTGRRFTRDRELLLVEYEKNPEDARTVFYLAQTCSCLGLNAEAYKYYEIRSKMPGFQEENFHCWLRMGDIARTHAKINEEHPENRIHLEKDTEDITLLRNFTWEIALGNYMKAFEHTPRAEPAVAIANYYRDKEKWLLSYHFARIACELGFPHDAILFIDNHVYDYVRYHVMGIVAYYCGRFKEGYEACQHVIKVSNQEIDKNNLKFYEDILFPQKKLKKMQKIGGRRQKRR
jgi:glycosyltransferase involved in cell wall biosynthesis